ncbi:MAG: NUDIX hydrolase [Candidatus Saccharimonadales bacterium]
MMKISHDSETPAKGQQVISVCGFIHHKFNGIEKVFLAKRAETKKFLPGLYEMPGGHVDFGEDIVDALKREVTEEFGMSISVGDPFASFTYQNLIKQSHSIEVIYFATFTQSHDNVTINPEDHSEYGWFTKAEVLSTVSDNRQLARRNSSVKKDSDEDLELTSILKGFSILEGEALKLG